MKRSLVIGGVAVAAAASLALVPTAALGHTDGLFTWSYTPVGSDAGGFSSVSKTDAALALLGESTLEEFPDVTGAEVCDEVGYAVGFADKVDVVESTMRAIATWDHSTGAILTGPTELTIDGQAYITDVRELDTLADCSIITLAELDGGNDWAIIEVDAATGAAEVLAELPLIEGEYTGLATDASGVTYLFMTFAGYPYYRTVDLGAGTFGPASALDGLSDYFESSGFTQGVDFDATGGLWAVTGVDAEEQYHLISFAAGAELGTATPTDSGVLPYEGEGLLINAPIPLTAEGSAIQPVQPVPAPAPAQPQLAATGSELPAGIAAVALALLAAGGVMLVVRRRAA